MWSGPPGTRHLPGRSPPDRHRPGSGRHELLLVGAHVLTRQPAPTAEGGTADLSRSTPSSPPTTATPDRPIRTSHSAPPWACSLPSRTRRRAAAPAGHSPGNATPPEPHATARAGRWRPAPRISAPRRTRLTGTGGQALVSDSFTAKPRKRAPAAEVAVADRRLRRRKAADSLVPPRMRAVRYRTLASWARAPRMTKDRAG